MQKGRVLIVGLDEPEVSAIRDRLDCMTVAYEYLPNIKLVEGKLLVESRTHASRFLPVDRVVYHGIFDNDFDFLTLLALWGGPCLPDANGMMDCRLRHSGLVRALRVTKFGNMLRGMSINGETWYAEYTTVAKWGNWHCGENKAKFAGSWTPPETTVFEPFIAGEAVRVVLIGSRFWQIRLTGDDWLKSIHHPDAAEMPVDEELLADTRELAKYFNLATVGVDYMINTQGNKYLLEVNHIPNVTVFPFIREAFIDLVSQWCTSVSDEKFSEQYQPQ
ncbi:hypothetical protein [Fischerella sp. JS2]|uniref:hypothetical protein n=1 Tax=Fischerella sp. JS2 TaxID=2597771 RepID=UPI0028E7CB28|nr:hypothetical protein [Fischerella sp. JS2]